MKNNNPDVILPYYFVDRQGLIWPKTKDDFIYKKKKASGRSSNGGDEGQVSHNPQLLAQYQGSLEHEEKAGTQY